MRFSGAAELISAALVSLLLGVGDAQAHEGHDHGGAPPAIAASVAPRASSSSDAFELVAIARNGVVSVYLDRFQTNEPVTEARIDAQSPSGEARLEAQPDGSFSLPAPWSTQPGDHELVLTVTVDGVSDVFPLDLHVPDTAAKPVPIRPTSWFTTPAFAQGVRERLAAGDTALYAALGGFLAGILLMWVGRRRAVAVAVVLTLVASALPGAVGLADEGHQHRADRPAEATVSSVARDTSQRMPEGSVFVPKPTQRLLGVRTVLADTARHRRAIELPGRIIPDPNGSGLVQASAGGRLSPPAGGFPRLGTPVKAGDVLAYVTAPLQAIDVSDMRQRQGELDQQISILERRLSRLESLSKSGAVATAQLDEARLELRGLQNRRGAIERSRREPEALVAPTDGVIAEANAVAGQMAQSSAIVFQIVDPARLWVEALSFESLGSLQEASGRLGSGRVLALSFQGAGLADRSQAVPVQFRIEGDTTALRVGQFLTVFASLDEGRDGLALPRSSLVRDGRGQTVVYEHTAPERFDPREVRVEPLDGDRVAVVAGLVPGRRIVTQGAELLAQVR